MPLIAISLVSGGVIAFEVLLMRLYAIGQWHHFATLIISIALLGYGASGTFLALTRGWLLGRFLTAWQVNAVAFGLTAPLGFALARNFIVNPFELAWDPVQAITLSWIYLVLMVPFFCTANCVGLAFMRFSDRVGRVYRFDLVGAGLGAAAVVAALFLLTPSQSLRGLPVLGFAAAAVLGANRARGAVLAVCGLAIAGLMPASWLAPRVSEYKGLSRALTVLGTEIIEQSSSPLGLITVVRSPRVPFRHAPGLSLNSPAGPPEQLGLFVDAGAMSAITRFDTDPKRVPYLDFTTRAVAYHLLERPSVLILGAGGGTEVLLARYHEARRVAVAEPDPAIIRLLRGRFADFAGDIYDPERTTVYVADARGALAVAGSGYDLIQLAVLGAAGGAFGALQETYATTVEAFEGYLGRLEPGGLLAATGPLELPPRPALKLFAVAAAALERLGVAQPGRRLVLIRGFKTATLLIKKGDFTPEELDSVRGFARQRAFDLAYTPGLAHAEANRFNILDSPYLYDGARALLGPERAAFMADYKFDLRPASDDRPYFFRFLQVAVLARAAGAQPARRHAAHRMGLSRSARHAGAGGGGERGLDPPAACRLAAHRPARPRRMRVAVYFLALGLAFLFIEIAFIQRLTLFPRASALRRRRRPGRVPGLRGPRRRHDPATGQTVARRRPGLGDRGGSPGHRAHRACLSGGPGADDGVADHPAAAVKVPLTLLLIAPLAFFMGMPFPLGLARLAEASPGLVPWAWGINGCASVVSAVLATLLAIGIGFSAVVALAVALYLLAALVWRRAL